jgi:hypothetical protein
MAGAYVAHGQGSVSFGNYAVLGTYLYVTLNGAKLGGAGTGDPSPTLSNWALQENKGADWTVSLYGSLGAGQPASQMSPLGVTATVENGVGAGAGSPGTWYSSGVAEFSSAPNGTVATLQVYAWYNDGGMITSYASAVTDGVPTGVSSLANVTLAGPPASPANLPEGLGNVVIAVPEPSTIALGIVGASTFLMRLRRKQ